MTKAIWIEWKNEGDTHSNGEGCPPTQTANAIRDRADDLIGQLLQQYLQKGTPCELTVHIGQDAPDWIVKPNMTQVTPVSNGVPMFTVETQYREPSKDTLVTVVQAGKRFQTRVDGTIDQYEALRLWLCSDCCVIGGNNLFKQA